MEGLRGDLGVMGGLQVDLRGYGDLGGYGGAVGGFGGL